MICSDKTGTLTCNEMTVTELRTLQTSCRISGSDDDSPGIFIIEGRKAAHLPEDIEDLLTKATLCNDATLHQEATGWNITGDPTEAALLVAAAKAGISIENAHTRFPRLDSIPFSSENQYMATLHGGAEKTIVLKGAPEVILSRCHAAGQATDDSQQIMAEINRMGTRGMRGAGHSRQADGPGRTPIHSRLTRWHRGLPFWA